MREISGAIGCDLTTVFLSEDDRYLDVVDTVPEHGDDDVAFERWLTSVSVLDVERALTGLLNGPARAPFSYDDVA
jgi:hypothetical protein